MALTLLRQIQADLIASEVDIAAALRKSKILARRLRSKEFADWVNRELDGYPKDADVPSYRMVSPAHYANFSNGYQSLSSYPISILSIDEKYHEFFKPHLERHGIETVKGLAAETAGQISRNEFRGLLKGKVIDLPCTGFWSEYPGIQFKQILSTVASRLLDFVMDIEEENPDAGEASTSDLPVAEDRVQQLVSNHFYAPVGNIAQQSSHLSQSATVNVSGFQEVAALARTALSESPLTPGAQSSAEAHVATIEAQIASPEPNSVIVHEAGRSLRTIVEGTIAGVASQPGAWSVVINLLSSLLG